MGNMSGSVGGNYTLYQTLSQNSQNINNNTTNVTVRLVLSFDGKNYSYTYNTSYGYMIINGNRYDYSVPNIIFSSGQPKDLLLAEWTGDIPHNADGTKVLGISGYWDTGTSRIGSGSISYNVALNTIPRASNISCTTANVGEPALITIASASGSFTHDVWFDFGSLIDPYMVLSKVAGGIYSWTIPEDFYAQMPNSKSKSGRIYCRTYSNGREIGLKAADFTVTTNEEKCKPTLEATVKDINETTIALTGDENKLIKYRSTAQISISTSAKNSASIVSKKINNNVVTNDVNNITNIETNTFDIVSTDSRGYSTSLTLSPEIINYIPLSINAIVRRIQPTTGEVGITFTGNYFNGSFGSIENTLYIKWYYKENSSEEYILGGDLIPVIKDNTFSNGDSEIILGDFFDYQKSYNIQLEIVDKLTTLNPTYKISQGIPIFNWGKDFFNIYGDLQINEESILPISLYENLKGTTDNITLSENSENFAYMDIFFLDYDNQAGFQRVYLPNGKTISMVSCLVEISTNIVWVKTDCIKISGMSLSRIRSGEAGLRTDKTFQGVNINNGDYTKFKIIKIIGYKIK